VKERSRPTCAARSENGPALSANVREVLVLEPRELLRRMATLVPPPRAHLVRYHGVFGPASKWRGEIVPWSRTLRSRRRAPESLPQQPH
jgi:hypothetical protein